MRKLLVVIALLGGLLACVARSGDESPPPQPDLKRVCEDIVNLASHGDSKAFAYLHEQGLTSGKPLDEWNIEVRNSMRQLNRFIEERGPFVGCEFIAEQKVKEVFCRYLYVAKFAKGYTVWTFTFYRATDKWGLIKLDFNQNIELLFGPSAPSDTKQDPSERVGQG